MVEPDPRGHGSDAETYDRTIETKAVQLAPAGLSEQGHPDGEGQVGNELDDVVGARKGALTDESHGPECGGVGGHSECEQTPGE